MVTCVRASAVRIRPHQGRSNQPENIMKWTAFGRIYKWRTALYVNPRHAGKNRSAKVFFCKKYTPAEVQVGGSRRALEGRRKEPVGAMHVRPQAQPLPRIQRDLLRGEQARAGKRAEPLLCRLEPLGHRLVLLAQDAAGGVNQASARLNQSSRALQDAPLLLRQLLDRPRPMPPLQVGIASQRAEAAARRIDQHALELAREALGARVVV